MPQRALSRLGVEAAQLGVGIEGGLEELVRGVTVALPLNFDLDLTTSACMLEI